MGSELIHDSGLRTESRRAGDRGGVPPPAVATTAPSTVRAPPLPFSYDLYCDERGHFTSDGAAEALVLQPEHLRRVYQDAARGLARAQELIRELEEVFRLFGVAGADAITRPACLPLPELTPQCTPNWRFLRDLLGDTPEADRLRTVATQAYEAEARQRGARNAVLVAGLSLLWAGRTIDAAMSRAVSMPPRLPAAEGLPGPAGAVEIKQSAVPAAPRYTSEQSALIDMAKCDKRLGITLDDAKAYKELGTKVGVPVRGPEVHPNRPHGKEPHLHVGPVDHIPIRPEGQ